MKLEKLSPEFVKDLIPLVNSLGNLPKTAAVSYGPTRFNYVPLDDILARIKADPNFAFMQPLGLMADGVTPALQCILIHRSGEILASDSYPLRIKEGAKKQDEGAEITYSRRYVASSFFGIASDDDTDANNDGQPSYQQRQQTKPAPKAQKPAAKAAAPAPEPKPTASQLSGETRTLLNGMVEKYVNTTGAATAEVVKALEEAFGVKSKDFTETVAKKAIEILRTWAEEAIDEQKGTAKKAEGAN